MQKILSFLKSKTFLLQLSIIVGVLFFSTFGVYSWLNTYTNHGETITVPDLRGMKFSELESFLSNKSLRIKISDSSVFILGKPPGVVIEQDPAPSELVKENRTVYVTITRTVAPQVKIPNLVDVSHRQAEAILNSYGLKVGTLTYRPDLAKDAVLTILNNGRTLKTGDELPKGSVIDLVLGDGIGNTDVPVPQLIGLTLEEVMFVLQGSQLNAGATVYDASVVDTTTAKVYRQVPMPGDSVFVKQGESIDLYLH